MAKLAPFQLQWLVVAPPASGFWRERPSVLGRDVPPTAGWPSLPLAAAVAVLQLLPALARWLSQKLLGLSSGMVEMRVVGEKS